MRDYFKDNTVYAFRIDGETVVAKIKGREENYLILDDPQRLAFLPQQGGQVQVALVPFIPGISEDKEYRILESGICGISGVAQDLHNLYIQATTGLQIAANNGSLA